MPTHDVRTHLNALYTGSDDPWQTHSSAYEQMKFAQTVASLPRPRYRLGFEVGCGAGALTAHLAARCETLIAIDCTAAAIAAAKARSMLGNTEFIEGAVPENWPAQPPDLVILSEVLYFMTDDENAGLATRLALDCTPDSHVVLVNWLGDTGGGIGGEAAALRLIHALTETHETLASANLGQFRLDVLSRTLLPNVEKIRNNLAPRVLS